MSDTNAVDGSDEVSTVHVAPDSSGPSNDAVNSSTESPSGDVAKALSSIISSVIKEFDVKAQNIDNSQNQLSLSIDRLTRELDQLLEDAPAPFLMQHASRISGVRKRVSSLNLLLRSIQRRLDNVDRVISVGLHNGISFVGLIDPEKNVSESSAKPQ